MAQEQKTAIIIVCIGHVLTISLNKQPYHITWNDSYYSSNISYKISTSTYLVNHFVVSLIFLPWTRNSKNLRIQSEILHLCMLIIIIRRRRRRIVIRLFSILKLL